MRLVFWGDCEPMWMAGVLPLLREHFPTAHIVLQIPLEARTVDYCDLHVNELVRASWKDQDLLFKYCNRIQTQVVWNLWPALKNGEHDFSFLSSLWGELLSFIEGGLVLGPLLEVSLSSSETYEKVSRGILEACLNTVGPLTYMGHAFLWEDFQKTLEKIKLSLLGIPLEPSVEPLLGKFISLPHLSLQILSYLKQGVPSSVEWYFPLSSDKTYEWKGSLPFLGKIFEKQKGAQELLQMWSWAR